uniref:Uncharacterized protein n=1 Tax=viral metagenome TaxID=1070528 RepID=A0A6C0HHB0_9ZZZZ
MSHSSNLDITKLLHALDNEENENIIANNYEQISKEKNDILQKLKLGKDILKGLHQKLKQYRYVDSLEGIRFGAYIRWISLKNPDPEKIKLTNGGFICNIEILNDDIYITVKNNMNRLFKLKLSENLVFQKLMQQEQVILSAMKYLNKN